MERRTDVPGLATASDGRWDYPELVKPPLPAGSPGPFAAANKAGAHYADLRALLLPAPEGATVDRSLRGTDGWLPTKDFLAQYGEDDRQELGQKLTDDGLRHIAARGWTTRDGTRTWIYPLQFETATVPDDQLNGELTAYTTPVYPVRGAGSYEVDDGFPGAAQGDDVKVVPYVEAKPYGREQIRQAYLAAGDTLAVITQSRRHREGRSVPADGDPAERAARLRPTSSGGPGPGRVSWGPALSYAHPRSRSTRGDLLRNPAGPGLRRRHRLRRTDREEAVPGPALTPLNEHTRNGRS